MRARQFEYMTEKIVDISDALPRLNELGREGWQLVAYAEPDETSLLARAVLMRQVEPAPVL